MGFQDVGMPPYQVGNLKNVWGKREYGLSGLWVKRALTVYKRAGDHGFGNDSDWGQKVLSSDISET
jgi:hypothetical protein